MNSILQELDKLRIFVAVAERGQINSSADHLNLTQPSITRAIQKLEHAFGAEIFLRSRDGVRLTEAGELLYRAGTKILKDLENVQVQAAHLGKDTAGKITIGTYESLAEYLWPEVLGELQKAYPALHVSIATELANNPYDDLVNERVDLLVDSEPQLRQAVMSWPLYTDHYSFYVSKKFPVQTYSPVDVGNESLIYVNRARDASGETVAHHIERRGYKFAREYRFDSFASVKGLAIKGLGVAVLPRRLAEEDVKTTQLREIPLEGFSEDGFGKHSIYATVMANRKNDARIKAVLKILRQRWK